MQPSKTFKKSFLKLMINGLRLNGVHSKMMSIQERKRAIKLSADAAMALARGRTKWSASLIKDLSNKQDGSGNSSGNRNKCKWKIPTSKKILRRSLRPQPRMRGVEASVVARRMLKKRTRLLKRIIPGGESMDGISLLGETLDYVIHLRAQVNLMQCLASALGVLKSQESMHRKNERGIQELVCDDDDDEMGGSSRILQPREADNNSTNTGPKKLVVPNVMD